MATATYKNPCHSETPPNFLLGKKKKMTLKWDNIQKCVCLLYTLLSSFIKQFCYKQITGRTYGASGEVGMGLLQTELVPISGALAANIFIRVVY